MPASRTVLREAGLGCFRGGGGIVWCVLGRCVVRGFVRDRGWRLELRFLVLGQCLGLVCDLSRYLI